MKTCAALALAMLAVLLLPRAAVVEAHEAFYCPTELADMDFDDPASRWCWRRSKESAHFYCFWEAGFGDEPSRVDVDDLLEKVERFYRTNVDVIQMVDVGHGRSQLDRYKMQIYLLDTDEWVATGAGYDDVIGALWVSPATCQPVGATIAHEVAHCFQYQVYCDQLLRGETSNHQSGFRYGYACSNGGNGFWEQCAQWASFIDYPGDAVSPNEMGDWTRRANLAFEHEWTRYESYWLLRYWAAARGADVVGKIWNESRAPEDALAAYTRLILDGDWERCRDELCDYAAAMAAGQLNPPGAVSFADQYTVDLYDAGDGWRQVGYASCSGAGGFNLIPLPVSDQIAVEFQGLEPGAPLADGDPGELDTVDPVSGEPVETRRAERYNDAPIRAGWRYQLVALAPSGGVLSDMGRESSGTLSLNVPEDATAVYLVVVGAPAEIDLNAIPANPWDDDARTDAQLPYRFRILAD